MRVVVDLSVCQGYAQCAFLAPDTFRIVGEEGLMYDPEPPEELSERVRRAVAACPVQAIAVEVAQSGAEPRHRRSDHASEDGPSPEFNR
jgi:ferredoxin